MQLKINNGIFDFLHLFTLAATSAEHPATPKHVSSKDKQAYMAYKLRLNNIAEVY